jgi:hypothetical protein
MIILAAVVAFAGCQTLQVRSDYVSDVDFSAFKTFAQVAAPEQATGGVQGFSPITAERIQEAIADTLRAKGLAPASEDEADLLVGFSVDGQHRMDVFSFDTGWGWYGRDSVYTTHYVQGTLLIDIAERATKRVVWHGWGTDRIAEGAAPDVTKIRTAVEKILESFPPSPSPKSS